MLIQEQIKRAGMVVVGPGPADPQLRHEGGRGRFCLQERVVPLLLTRIVFGSSPPLPQPPQLVTN